LCAVKGFEKVTPQNHLSAVETLRRSKPLSVQRSMFADDTHQSSDAGATLAQFSPQKCGFPASADIATACCTASRAVNGKRRLSSGRRDDSSSGCERQRKYCGSVQRKLLPSDHQLSDSQPNGGREMLAETNDSVISQYLSFKVERMDLQSDTPSTGKPPSPNWMLPGKCAATNSNASNEKRTHDPDVVRSFTRYRHGALEVHRSGGRRCRKPSGSRPGTSSRDANYSARRRDDKTLDSFFSQMGMDARTLSATLSGSSAVSAFENVSSIDTSTLESRTSYAESEKVGEAVLDSFDVNERNTVVPSSIVERNARIIKWLCSIRKASTSDDIQFDEGFV